MLENPVCTVQRCADAKTLASATTNTQSAYRTLLSSVKAGAFRGADQVNTLISTLNATGTLLVNATAKLPNATDAATCNAVCTQYAPAAIVYKNSSHPPAMSGHSMNLYAADGSFFLFGGFICNQLNSSIAAQTAEAAASLITDYANKTNKCYSNDLWVFNSTASASMQWRKFNSSSKNLTAEAWPSPRAFHSAVVWQDYLYVFGGSMSASSSVTAEASVSNAGFRQCVHVRWCGW